uniref:Integrase, catalytic region, zinc finger, CCHC-type, peptidase aspartic, catalytic n=1 Tax=Tanacetum cinerariifolium TaxID=118510 RepID=A0A6L2NEQ1_TANCI|nr:hypothetical protein [Tanacetum cinerariifolium]
MDSIIPLGRKNTPAKYMILSSVDNRPPMLDKDLYDSLKNRMEVYMQNRDHGRMILELVEIGPLTWPIVEENGMTKTKKYVELSAAEKIQADCDMKATNIILQGLLADIYSLEKECKLYDAFDKFTHIKEESLHKYYLRFTQLINDMNVYNMKMEQFQVNTKFLNSLPPKLSKFVADIKLVKDLHTTNFDQLHAYLEQHELHANEVRLLHERDNPIACLNKAMAFLTTVASSRGDKGKVILVLGIRVMLLVLGETIQADMQGLLNATTIKVKDIWLVNALSLSDQRMQNDGQAVQKIIPNNAGFQTEDLDTYDSNCDDISNAKVVLMANISIYGSDVISKKAQWIKPTLYDGIVMSDKHIAMPVIDNEETLILEEESRSRILTEDFRKRFTSQQELSAEQAFLLRMSDPTSKPSDALLVKIESPKELPKISLVNESLKKLKFHLAKFDNVVKIRTTPNTCT